LTRLVLAIVHFLHRVHQHLAKVVPWLGSRLRLRRSNPVAKGGLNYGLVIPVMFFFL